LQQCDVVSSLDGDYQGRMRTAGTGAPNTPDGLHVS
jgi:hypothetical protein